MPPNQHTPEEIEDMEHWQRQSIANQYDANPNAGKTELKEELIEAVETPAEPDVVEHSPEEIREMEYYERQSIASEFDVHPNLPPSELENELLEKVSDGNVENEEKETPDSGGDHEDDESESEDNVESEERKTPGSDGEYEGTGDVENEERSTIDAGDTEQSSLSKWEPETIDYPEFNSTVSDDEMSTRVELTDEEWGDSPTGDSDGFVNDDRNRDGGGHGAERLAEAIVHSGTALTGSDRCPNCTHQKDNTIFYDNTHAACLGCRSIYPLSKLGLTPPDSSSNDTHHYHEFH
ncbi:hypothetical protein QA600_14170 [Natronococcus sp. A-GB1]|uniref:hypothetical protein n=1 Tax=Natronococcus sp. A-GB1 TaxID=3037648 RepID=UPI00241D7DF0|nr:hypothetical protein [Natronococcus sp. A-GB1]MDG5760483.1 hypothetical protein [Natronococcus sp. A-GB1]